jgi:hypothetical protein
MLGKGGPTHRSWLLVPELHPEDDRARAQPLAAVLVLVIELNFREAGLFMIVGQVS